MGRLAVGGTAAASGLVRTEGENGGQEGGVIHLLESQPVVTFGGPGTRGEG